MEKWKSVEEGVAGLPFMQT